VKQKGNKQMSNMNWTEALNHFGLSFDMETVPLGILNQYGNYERVPGILGMRRADTLEVLEGVSVGERYEVIQTASYADVGDRITGNIGAEFTKGGVLAGGKIAYLQAKLPDSIRVKGTDDVIDKTVTFLNSFDGSIPFTVLPLTWRIICANQMVAVMREAKRAGTLKIRHTRNAQERIKKADEVVLEVLNAYKTFSVKLDWLADQRFTDAQMDLLGRSLFNVDPKLPEVDIATRTVNNINKLKELFVEGQGQTQWRGTGYAALNALTEFTDHHRALRGTTDPFEANLIGSGALMKDKGLDLINQIILA
jgi:phage/plasmid-like protein (TIGR03299 family)